MPSNRDKIAKVVRQVDRKPRNPPKLREASRLAVPVFRGVTTTVMTAHSGAVDGFVMVQKYRWNGSVWVATSDPPIKVYNDSKNTTTAAGYRCKWTLCEGFPTLLTMDCSAG